MRKKKHLFRKRVVVFIDILGFGNMVRKAHTSNNQEDYDKVHEALKRIRKLSSKAKSRNITGIEVHIFSDSVIISIPPKKEATKKLIEALSYLIWDLLKTGVWIRGGISYGDHSADKNTPWGPAVVEAYRIEDTIADYPRIAISKTALGFMRDKGVDPSEVQVSRDEDGVYSVDSVKFMLMQISKQPRHSKKESDLKKIKDELDKAYEEAVDNPRVYLKVIKLCDQWDEFFESADCHLDKNFRTKYGLKNSLVDIWEHGN